MSGPESTVDHDGYCWLIGFLGEEHPLPVVVDGEVWPDAEHVTPDTVLQESVGS